MKPRTPSSRQRECLRALTRAGFVLRRQEGSPMTLMMSMTFAFPMGKMCGSLAAR